MHDCAAMLQFVASCAQLVRSDGIMMKQGRELRRSILEFDIFIRVHASKRSRELKKCTHLSAWRCLCPLSFFLGVL